MELLYGIFIMFLVWMWVKLDNEFIAHKAEAIKRGFAEYKVDEHGNSTFCWKDNK